MPYCTVQDIALNVFPSDLFELTKSSADVNSDNKLSDNQIALIESLIAKADNEIDDFCRAHYDLPFSPVPGTIKDISVSIVIYYLYSRSKDLEYDHPKRIRYNDAVNRLKLINSGTIQLTGNSSVTQPSALITNKTASQKLFTDRFLERMP